MQKLKVHFICIEPVDGRTMPERWPADDRRISWRPTATGRCPASHRWATGRSSSGHRQKILSSAKWIGRSPNSRLAVAGRRPLPDFYDIVQGRKNPAMICRCQKTGIGEKSGDHRRIYKACEVGIRKIRKLMFFSGDITRGVFKGGGGPAGPPPPLFLPPAHFWKQREVLFWGPSPYPPSPWMFCFISRLLLKLAFETWHVQYMQKQYC